ncbi:MAG: hypothetical protein KAG61_05665 [Bacteriovoracaceae bacterium]|nr:hypothetical protein [Bacteriovoracaceae bacterium]
MDQKQFLALGNEAAAMAAIDAGLYGFFGYPGTPSTEVFEAGEALIENMNDGRTAKWGPNEKVGYEMALGCSYVGKRSICTMKHVGLNVAMDPFISSALTGANGGLVLLVADDPSMHSSQNEQDSRVLAQFAMMPCLEPSNPQEVYDMTYAAFDLSEKLNMPIMIRMTTRTSHSRGIVNRNETRPIAERGMQSIESKTQWVLMPQNARVRNRDLRARQVDFAQENNTFNSLCSKPSRKAVVTSGMGKAYFEQLLIEEPSVADYSRLDIKAYPIDEKLINDLLANNDEIIVFEESYPMLEDRLIDKAYGSEVKIRGRRDEALTIDGELTPKKLRMALDLPLPKAKAEATMDLAIRPPKLCDGCGHADAFLALKEAYKLNGNEDQRVFGDIGCYTLGYSEPYNAIHATIEMGGSFGMAYGAAMSGHAPSVGVLGDSTFFHSGINIMTAAADCKKNVNFIIMDNRITAMTGQQQTVVMNRIEDTARAAGYPEEDIITMTPLKKNHEENVAKCLAALQKPTPTVLIFRRDCIEAMRKGYYKKIAAKKEEK